MLPIVANSASFLGVALAAIIAFRQQETISNLLHLARSSDPHDQELAEFFEERHKRYLFGMTIRQLRFFWLAIAMAVGGQFLLLLDAVLTFLD